MRFLSLRIANYRAVRAACVEFASSGITLVQGPNEVGKTSLAEAIGLLFDFPDNSKDKSVKAIKPVDRDEGSEIELEAESGPYVFTYFKRFHKRPETKLSVRQPRPENLTGREAHDRAEGILRETLDVGLWRALTVQQGDAIQQPSLASQTSLSAALDRAAGGRSSDPHEEGLFEHVQDEYLNYYTERGAERKELPEARRVQAEAQAEITRLEQSLRELDHDVTRGTTLESEVVQLRRKEEELKKQVAVHCAELDTVVGLESALERARLSCDSKSKSEQAAQLEVQTRHELVEAVSEKTRAHRAVLESVNLSQATVEQAEKDLKQAQEADLATERTKKDAENLAALRRADFDHLNDCLFLDQMTERKERVDRARANATQAEDVLARTKVTAKMLKTIQDAERASLAARAQMETGVPNVLLRGLAECQIRIDDSKIRIGKGKTRKIPVLARTKLTIPETIEMEISAGTSSAGLSAKAGEARAALAKACAAAGVGSPEEALGVFDERAEADRQIRLKGQIEKDELRDLSYEELERKLRLLQKQVPEYTANRVASPIICADIDSARKEWATAEAEHVDANREWKRTHGAHDAARDFRENLTTKHEGLKVQLEILTGDLKHASGKLAAARALVADEALERRLVDLASGMAVAKAEVAGAEAALRAANPDRVRTLAETAGGSLRTTQDRLAQVQTELTEVQTRLKILGEEGLQEKLEAAQARFGRVSYEYTALDRRAAAAKFLFELMRSERDQVRRAYVGPLRQKVEALGRLVFDEALQVDISDDLQIASRTERGVTVPFDSLSGGTREQLSLILRLACSMIVAKDGGTPVMLDDALGYTDPERLRLMGAVLAKAARECQIVIFSCVPDRYAEIGKAHVVKLG